MRSLYKFGSITAKWTQTYLHCTPLPFREATELSFAISYANIEGINKLKKKTNISQFSMTFLASTFKNMTNVNELIYTAVLSLWKLFYHQKCPPAVVILCNDKNGSYLPNFRKRGAVHTHVYTIDWHGATGYL